MAALTSRLACQVALPGCEPLRHRGDQGATTARLSRLGCSTVELEAWPDASETAEFVEKQTLDSRCTGNA